MSRFTKQITSYWQQFRTVVRNEYGLSSRMPA